MSNFKSLIILLIGFQSIMAILMFFTSFFEELFDNIYGWFIKSLIMLVAWILLLKFGNTIILYPVLNILMILGWFYFIVKTYLLIDFCYSLDEIIKKLIEDQIDNKHALPRIVSTVIMSFFIINCLIFHIVRFLFDKEFKEDSLNVVYFVFYCIFSIMFYFIRDFKRYNKMNNSFVSILINFTFNLIYLFSYYPQKDSYLNLDEIELGWKLNGIFNLLFNCFILIYFSVRQGGSGLYSKRFTCWKAQSIDFEKVPYHESFSIEKDRGREVKNFFIFHFILLLFIMDTLSKTIDSRKIAINWDLKIISLNNFSTIKDINSYEDLLMMISIFVWYSITLFFNQ